MNAFHQAAISFVGQNYGAAQCGRVDKVARQCVAFAVLFGLALGNLAYLFGTPWPASTPRVSPMWSGRLWSGCSTSAAPTLSAVLWTPWWACCGGWAARLSP